MISVFISHNWKDKPLARKISNVLNQYGIDTWIDEAEIKIGDSLIGKIRDGLDRVDYVIALISQFSVESEWVKKELDIAMNHEIDGKRVVVLPILARKCELPGFLKGKLYADMSTPKMFTKGISQILARLEIKDMKHEGELLFTSERLSAVQIIKTIQTAGLSDRIRIWNSIDYSDWEIFKINAFSTFYLTYLNSSEIENNEICVMLQLVKRIRVDSIEKVVSKIDFVKLIKILNEDIAIAVIEILIKYRIRKTEVVDTLLEFLESEDKSKNIERKLEKYFLKVKIYNEYQKEEVVDFFWNRAKSCGFPKEIREITAILFVQLEEDEAIERIKELVEKQPENKEYVIEGIALLNKEFNGEYEGFFIKSYRLRAWFKDFILSSFTENDVQNADIICVLISWLDSQNLFEIEEIWQIICELDNYSIAQTLEEFVAWYNIPYIFSSNSDVTYLKKLLEKGNSDIRKLALDILAEISLKSAIDVLVEACYEPQYYNVDNIIMTLMKETDIVSYKDFYLTAKKEALSGNYVDALDNIITAVCDYCVRDISSREIINALEEVSIDKVEYDMRNNDRKLRFICEFLNERKSIEDDVNVKRAFEKFIIRAKKYY